jgi:hypothetical protein
LGIRKKGFIVHVKSGDRRSCAVGRKASEWRLTCLPYQGEPPTLDYHAAHHKALAPHVDPNEKFLTPELEERTLPKRAAFSNANHQAEDEGNLTGIDGGAQPAPTIVSLQRDQLSQAIENVDGAYNRINPANGTRLSLQWDELEPAKLPWRRPAYLPKSARMRLDQRALSCHCEPSQIAFNRVAK